MEAQETVSGENPDEAAKMIAKEIFQGSRKRDRDSERTELSLSITEDKTTNDLGFMV